MDTAVAGERVEQLGASAAKTGTRRRTLLLSGGAILLIVGAVWGVRWWTVGRFIESTDDAYLQADSVTIAPKVSGYVAEVYVADNQSVKAGEPLVRLDRRQYQAVLEQANATIAARRADIERGAAELLQQQASIAQARAQLQGARSAESHAIEEVKRYEPLVATGAETKEKLADLQNERAQAAATVAADMAAVQAAERQPAATQAQLDTQDTVIRSTLDGRVGDRTVRVGQFAQPGTRLMTIVPVQDVYLEANFKETQIGLMRAGQPATIHVDALPGIDLHGTVVSFSPGTGSQFAMLPPQNATGNFTKIVQRMPVRIHIDAGQETRSVLVPGLSVTVKVDTRSGQESAKRLERENARG